jgi:hypothetical protein
MRFFVGQGFERVADGKKPVVEDVREDGGAGLFRFDDSHVEWFLSADFNRAGEWRQIGV